MPELPDVLLYQARIAERLAGGQYLGFRAYGISALRSIGPQADWAGSPVADVTRLGKRIVIALAEERFIVIHPMIAGRFTWTEGELLPVRPPNRIALFALRFSTGILGMNEATKKKRAGIWFVESQDDLGQFHRTGIDPLTADESAFAHAIRQTRQWVKNALRDPNAIDGIGNTYSDEILFQAQIAPQILTDRLTDEQINRLYIAIRETLKQWIAKLDQDIPGFPKPNQITAFRPEFYVHGRYGQPCRVCGSPIQRIEYEDRETNYCARCQNEGQILADRALSRLLKDAYPRVLDD